MVERFVRADARWPADLAHLERVAQLRYALDDARPKPNCHFLGIAQGDVAFANLSVQEQDIVVAATAGTGGQETPLHGPDGRVPREVFVQTFAVHPAVYHSEATDQDYSGVYFVKTV